MRQTLPTLRDTLACYALNGVLQAEPSVMPGTAAVRAYELADAMLEARDPNPTMRLAVEAAHGAAEEDGEPQQSDPPPAAGQYEDDFSQITEKYDFANQ